MTKRELVEKLKQDIPKFEGTKEEKELKTALYIYIELGKTKSFDEKYYYGNSQTKKKIYKLAQKDSKNIDEVVKKKKIICVSLTNLYCEVLKEFGIQAVATAPEEDGHINTMIITKNNDKIEADLQLDLENIQTKSKLEHFNYKGNIDRNSNKILTGKEITKMLIEIGYINDENDYKNKKIEKLIKQVEKKGSKEALETIVNNEDIYKDNEEMDIIEINKFYRGLFKKVIPNYLDKKIYLFSCYRKKDNGDKDYTICSFSEGRDIKPYIFSKKARRFTKIDMDKLEQFKNEGLVLGTRKGEAGAKLLEKHIEVYKKRKNTEIEK